MSDRKTTGWRAASSAAAWPAGDAADGADRIQQQAFDLDETDGETPDAYRPFFENDTLTAGLYELAAGEEDRQPVRQRDEIYLVTRGAAILRAGDKVFPAGPGGMFFIAAGVRHRFEDITEDLQVIVFFSKAPHRKPLS